MRTPSGNMNVLETSASRPAAVTSMDTLPLPVAIRAPAALTSSSVSWP